MTQGHFMRLLLGTALLVMTPALSATAAIECYQCHGTSGPVDYRPLDTAERDPATGGFKGNHRTHLGAAVNSGACTICHPGSDSYGASHSTERGRMIKVASHLNNSLPVTPYNNSTSAFPQTSTPNAGTCQNVNCHFERETPTWGTPTFTSPGNCSKCHGAAPADGSHPTHAAAYGAPGVTNSCVKCHADHRGEANPFAHATSAGNRGLIISFAAAPNNGAGSYSGDTSYPHYLPSQAPARNGICTNLYCHSNGTSIATGTIPANSSPAWGSGSLACNGCHGNRTYTDFRKAFPLYTTGKPKANSHGIHALRGVTCKQCHAQVTSDNTSIADTSRHAGGSYDVNPDTAGGISFTYTFNAGGGTCTNISCHGNTTAQWGAPACLGCHSATQGKRVAVATQFGAQSHHIQGTLSNALCYQCHWESDGNGYINTTYHGGAAASGAAVDLVLYGAGSRPTSYTAGVTYVAYSANSKRAQIRKLSSHCLGCHSDQNNGTTPFGDGMTPKQYAWDGTSVSARYAQTGITTWGKYSTVTNAAQKRIRKAYSAHGNAAANRRYWDTTTGVDGNMSAKDSSGSVNVECYDCHNSHGSAASGITSRYSSATGRYKGAILKDTVRGFGGYSTTYQPRTGGSAARKNLRNPGASLCLDCHQSATPKQALAFRGYTTPWGYSSTYGATQAIIGYWDSPFMGYSTAAAGPKLRYPYKGANLTMGGHFGASSPLSSPPDANHQINGLCTPCHDPHGVSPTLNQPYSVPLLKGTWVTSPYKEDVAPANNVAGTFRTDFGFEGVQYHIDQNTFNKTSISYNSAVAGITQSDAQSAGLCLGCHAKANLTNGTDHTWKSKDRVHEAVKGWKTANTTYQHNYTCSKCHSPHTSSVLPRLMVTDCLDGVHKGRSGNNPGAVISGSGYGDDVACYGMAQSSPTCATPSYLWGSGSGRIPGYYNGGDSSHNTINCHEGKTGSGTDQRWNIVTPWTAP